MSDTKNGKPVILLVDDSEFSLSQCVKALGDEFEVRAVRSGAEALTRLEHESFDLIVTDLLMPQISGLAFLGQVRQRYPDKKIVVCSADIQDATSEKARALGAAAFIGKPIDPEEFRRIVRVVVSTEGSPGDLPITPRYADAFKEIFNIGVGRAARALSKLVFDTVKLSVPQLEILKPHHLAGYIADAFKEDVACVRQNFEGTTDGSAYLLLDAKSGMSLVNALVRDNEPSVTELSDADTDLLTEVGNILINSLVGTLSNTLGIEFAFGQAECKVGTVQTIYADLQLRDADYVLYVETLFVVPGRNIGGTLVILLGSAGMGTVLSRIDSLY